MIEEHYYDDVSVGDTGTTPSVTVTEQMIADYAAITGDFSPIHMDEAFAATTEFGQRIAHGLLGLSLTDGLKCQSDMRFAPCMSLGWSWDFRKPIFIGDELTVTFEIASKRETSKPGWGIVVLASKLTNQRGEVVQDGEHKLMVPLRPDADAA